MSVFRVALNTDASKASLKELVLDNRYASPKINTKANPPHVGNIFLNWSSSMTLALGVTKIIHQFPHGYGYVPSVFGLFTYDDGTTKQSGTFPFQFGAIGMVLMDADATNVYFKYFSVDGGSPLTTIPSFVMQVRFYVMAERAKE